MAYIKSYSNYVLKTKHQLVSDGTVWERDMSTIGGLDQFAPGQVPIYRSGNFIITVRGSHQATNKYENVSWSVNDEGYDWTLENLSEMTSVDGAQKDTKITLNKDFYDFRDFAYYGSLSDLLRGSINDIITRFPGEMCQTSLPVYYNSAYTEDFVDYESAVRIGEDENHYELNNPFNIDALSQSVHKQEDTLGYFANEGYLNYSVITAAGEEKDITEWVSHIYVRKILDKTELDTKYGATGPKSGGHDLFYMSFLGGNYALRDGWKNGSKKGYLDVEYRPIHDDEDSHDYLTNEDYFEQYYSAITATIYNGEKVHPLEWQFNDTSGAVFPEIQKFHGKQWVTDTLSTGTYYEAQEKGSAAIISGDPGYCYAFKEQMQSEARDCVDNSFCVGVMDAYEAYNADTAEYTRQFYDGEITRDQYLDLTHEALVTYVAALNEYEGELVTCLSNVGQFGIDYTQQFYDIDHLDPINGAEIVDKKYERVWQAVDNQFTIYDCINCETADCYVRPICPPEKIGSFKVIDEEGTKYPFTAWLSNNRRIVYLALLDGEARVQENTRIRPKSEFLDRFYEECDDIQRLILNPNTTPKYTSTFAVIRENDYGYYREFEDFTFPVTYGDYNIDPTCQDFSLFAERLGVIGAFYDDRFSDNLYRSMTHEAIKNFDWTFTREYDDGLDNIYEHGGNKMKKALRLFAREFDWIKSYIDSIQYSNRITYDQRGNLANYFLTDTLADDGWDVCMVTPYLLTETSDDGNVPEETLFNSQQAQLYNSYDGSHITRNFYQVTDLEVVPYKVDKDSDDYFVICVCNTGQTGYTEKTGVDDYVDGTPYIAIETDGMQTYYDACRDAIVRAIRSYSADTVYTSLDINNEFFRRMKLNSRALLRHKGTVEGMEMMLAMFGMKSSRFDSENYDYEITEYSSFAYRIEESWDVYHQMYEIDWINTTKLIRYDNRFTVRYPYDDANPRVAYQGLPVAYRDEYESATTPYLGQNGPCGRDGAYVYGKKPVLRRYLYPSFEQYDEFDGNPYFQMDGGWFSGSIAFKKGDGAKYNFQYTREDDVVYNHYVKEGSVAEMYIVDDEPLYRETSYDILRVETVRDMVSLPQYILSNSIICYVAVIKDDLAVIDGEVFDIKSEYDSQTGNYRRYVSLFKEGGHVSVGTSVYFYDSVVVFDKNGVETMYVLADYPDSFEIKAYIGDQDDAFVCKDTYYGDVSIENFSIIYAKDEDSSNFFMLSDIYSSRKVSEYYDNAWSEGWRRLMKSDYEYKKLSIGYNYFKGNNPHTGLNHYDKGHEYFTYFRRLFRYAADNNLFDERCYDDMYDALDKINKIGFSGMIHQNVDIRQYDSYLIEDGKVHYFGNYKKPRKDEGSDDVDVMIYGEDKDRVEAFRDLYCGVENETGATTHEEGEEPVTCKVDNYILSASTSMVDGYTGYTAASVGKATHVNGVTIDEVTNQVMNNKRLKIRFRLHYKWYSKDGQSEIKYLSDVVMPYLTQMIPSTTIFDVEYYDEESTPVTC